MMRILIALVLYALMCPAQAIDWAGLWRNPDQQGEAMLQRGDAAAAAKVYTDRRRKAYAEFQAGDYAGAARDLSAFDDSDAEYNRGNALAHAGDLQGAIGAYDAALKRDPHNRDAAHNRELVQNALKQQPPQQQQDSNSGQSKPSKPDQGKPGGQNSNDQGSNSQGASGQDQGKQGGRSGGQQGNSPGSQGNPQQPGASSAQSGGSQSSQQGGQQGQGANNGQQQSAANSQAQPGQSGDNASSSQDTATQSDKGASGKDASADGASNAQAMQPGEQQHTYAQGRDDAEQARRDAAASLGQANSGKQNGSIGAGQSMPPESEQQLAQDQWLRSIPDDPGGLLRRKFMIEYMLRQQKVNP